MFKIWNRFFKFAYIEMCGSLLENGRFVVRLTGRGVEMGKPIYRKCWGKFRNEFQCNFSEAKTFYKVPIGAIFARNVFLEAISVLVLGGGGREGRGGGGKMCRGWRGQSIAKCMAKSTPNSTVNCMAKSMANSMAIPRLISEAKSRKSLEIVEDDKNLK